MRTEKEQTEDPPPPPVVGAPAPYGLVRRTDGRPSPLRRSRVR
ncbi:hypothetical protein [Streptomyces sp. NPDC004435]